jgi:hypothetical protein
MTFGKAAGAAAGRDVGAVAGLVAGLAAAGDLGTKLALTTSAINCG